MPQLNVANFMGQDSCEFVVGSVLKLDLNYLALRQGRVVRRLPAPRSKIRPLVGRATREHQPDRVVPGGDDRIQGKESGVPGGLAGVYRPPKP